jgi:DNA-binding NtrC family response regulator
VSGDVLEILERQDWEGNVRELENLVERAVVFARSPVITRENLPDGLLGPGRREPVVQESGNDGLGLRDQTLAFQKRLIEATLRRAKGIQKNAALMLDVKPTTLNEMIKRLRIDVDAF